jgi:large repetitive protein
VSLTTLKAQLDAAGYLIEHRYDGAGRLTQQTAYANATPVSARANATLETLRPAKASKSS